MKISGIVDAIGYIDDDLITASIDYKPRKIKMKWLPCAAAAACAACFCILMVRISNDNPGTSRTIVSGSDVNSGIISSASTPPVSESSGITNSSYASNTSGDTITSFGENPGSSKPEDPGTSDPYPDFPPTGGGDPPPTGGGEGMVDDGPPSYDKVFKGIRSDSSANEPLSYDEVMEMIDSQRENDIFLDSFYLVEMIGILPIKDSNLLMGGELIGEDETIYMVRILTDLISGETVESTESIVVSMGSDEWQINGDPVYASGERFTVALAKPQEGCGFLRAPSSITFRYDAVEDENGDITLYSRGSGLDKLKLPTSVDISETVITSTTLNPAKYTQRLDLNALADFLREDWKARGVSSHFEDVKSYNSSESNQDSRNISNTEPAVEPNAYLITKPATFSTAKEQVKFADVKEVSGADFVGYELDYVMPSETLFALRYVYSDGEVYVRDNSGDCGVIVISPEWYEKIERDGMVFWKSLVHDSPTAIYISESDVAYIGTFNSDADLSKAIDTIKSLI